MATYWKPLTVSLSLFYFLLNCVYYGQSLRIKEKIYIDLVTQNGCFRLLNGTHQIGCSSSQAGDTGVVYYITTQKDMEVVTQTGTTTPYVAVLDILMFNSANVRQLVRSGRVAGIAVISTNMTGQNLPGSFSPDRRCPNDAYGLYSGIDQRGCKDIQWNQAGDGLFFDDLSIPMFSLTSPEDVDKVINICWDHNNRVKTYPLCAMQMMAAMTAAKDSETCIRRSRMVTNLTPMTYCDPIGDWNIVATVKDVPSNETREDRSVIVVATRMDSFGMFANEYPSADSSVAGIVSLLATAKTLWQLRDDIRNKTDSKDILFVFFQGEAFDYIGSSRMLYDMKEGKFPQEMMSPKDKTYLQKIELSHIYQFLELNQVGMRSDSDSLWMHVDPYFYNSSKTEMETMLARLAEFGNGTDASLKVSSLAAPLPPSSLQRFLMEARDSRRPLPSLVVTDHNTTFTNKFYNSRLDLPWQIGADYPSDMNDTEAMYNANTTQSKRIASLASVLARYLYWAATGQNLTEAQTATLTADMSEVNHMLYCLLRSPHCELFNATISPDDAKALSQNTQPYPFYVSVSTSKNQVTSLVERVLAYYTGTVVENATTDSCEVSGDDKEQRYSMHWMQGPQDKEGQRKGVCYKSTVASTKAESPAFLEDTDYDWSSRKYSTWTESRWEVFKVRVFLISSQPFQVVTLTVGILILVVSLVAVYFFSSSADVLFQSCTPEPSAL